MISLYAPPLEFEHQGQKAYFGIPDHITRIGVSLSGGMDSALALYILCSYVTENNINVTIVPWTGIDRYRPTNQYDVVDIVDFLKETFPDIPFYEHQWWNNTAEWIDGVYYTKVNHDNREIKKIIARTGVNMGLNGRTANPPADIIESFDIGTTYEPVRSHDKDREVLYASKEYPWYYTLRPWENSDKRMIVHLYKELNLMDNLYPLTWSCIGKGPQTEWFTKPCEDCFWCKEKKWAFNNC